MIECNETKKEDSDNEGGNQETNEESEKESDKDELDQFLLKNFPNFSDERYHTTLNKLTSYRIEPEKIELIRNVLSKFCGTHKFHNYTSSKSSNDTSVQRYIMNFVPGKVFVDRDIEWMSLIVTGQSFLLHQIRKMVAMCTEVIRGNATEDIINRSFEPEKMVLPLAPSTGLFLDRPCFEYYNQKFADAKAIFNWDSDVLFQPVNQFKTSVIFPHIIQQETTSFPFLRWLYCLHQTRPKYN